VTEGRFGLNGGVLVNKQFRTADKCVLSAWKLGERRKIPYHNKPARYDVLCTSSDLTILWDDVGAKSGHGIWNLECEGSGSLKPVGKS